MSQDEDILLKLAMPGKSQRIDLKDAPQLPEQKQTPEQQPHPTSSQPQVLQDSQQSLQTSEIKQTPSASQPSRETNTVAPPANTPPPSAEAQDTILRKLSMKPKDSLIAPSASSQERTLGSPPGHISQTPEEMRCNKPYVSSDHEIERVKKLAQNIYGSDMVQKRIRKK